MEKKAIFMVGKNSRHSYPQQTLHAYRLNFYTQFLTVFYCDLLIHYTLIRRSLCLICPSYPTMN
jgi:hypothetical protein